MTTLQLPDTRNAQVARETGTPWGAIGSHNTSATLGADSVSFLASASDALTRAIASVHEGEVLAETGSQFQTHQDRDRLLHAVRVWLARKNVVELLGRAVPSEGFPLEAVDFAVKNGIFNKVFDAVTIARRCFSVVGMPVINLVDDPESEGYRYLVIELQTRGTVKDNVSAHRQFCREANAVLGGDRDLIRIDYDII